MRGLRAASGDLLVLITTMRSHRPLFWPRSHDRSVCTPIGHVAGVLMFAHRPDLVASAGIEVGRDGVHRDARMLQPATALPTTVGRFLVASGGAVCSVVPRWQMSGWFAEHSTNYEDADLAWRLRLRGWRCLWLECAGLRISTRAVRAISPAKRRLLALNRWRVLRAVCHGTCCCAVCPRSCATPPAMAYGARDGTVRDCSGAHRRSWLSFRSCSPNGARSHVAQRYRRVNWHAGLERRQPRTGSARRGSGSIVSSGADRPPDDAQSLFFATG